MREFAAEIKSLGRLRHKHLVNLQGWCKRKNDLLIVYDSIPNGSLDTLLFYPRDNFGHNGSISPTALARGYCSCTKNGRKWSEWEKVVIYRDVKSGNVLIDSEMNARLGDFGLARLYDHGTPSHTTNVVGTVGYIAPELTRNGKASTSTEVFAFGVVLLEIATGRMPTDSGHFFLVDCVMEYRRLGQILDLKYVVEEMELVLELELGLLCCHQRPDCRPTMRRVMRYLNGEDLLPFIDDWGSIDSQSVVFKTDARFQQFVSMEAIPKDTIMTFNHSSSTGAILSTSRTASR